MFLLSAFILIIFFQASAHPLLPLNLVTDLVGSLTKPIEGLTSTLTGTIGTVTNVVTGTLGTVTNLTTTLTNTLTATVEQLLGVVTGLLQTVLETLAKTLTSLIDTLGDTLDTALSLPVDLATGLLDTVTGSLNPTNISNGLTSALGPQIKAITGLVKKVTGAVGCVVNTALGSLTTEILKGVFDTLKCATPIVKEVGNATKLVGTIVGGTVSLASGTLENITKCASGLGMPPDLGKVLSCVLGPVGQGVSQVTGIVGETTPVITSALKTALGVPQCAQKALTNGLQKANALLSDIVKCANLSGITASLPVNLPTTVPNFTAIADKALATIQEIVSAATGPNSTIHSLLASIDKLKNTVTNIDPAAIKVVVDNGVKGIQDALDSIKNVVAGSTPTSPEVKACVEIAQKTVSELAAPVVKTISTCVASIGPNATSLISQGATLDVGFQTEKLQGGINAVQKCFGTALKLDNSAENCFQTVIAELRSFIAEKLQKVTDALKMANVLIEEAEKCLSSGLGQLDKAGQAIISEVKKCLVGQGVPIATENITAAIVAGRAAINKAVANLTSSINVVETTNENIKGTVDFVATINSDLVQSVVGPTVDQAMEALSKIAESLKTNTNPAVKICIVSSKNRLAELGKTALQSANDCISSNASKIATLAAQAAQEETAVKEKAATATARAEAQCKTSVSTSAAQNCFANFQVTLNAEVGQTIDRVQAISDEAQVLLSMTINCVNNAPAETSEKVDAELNMAKSCLSAQNVDANIIRT